MGRQQGGNARLGRLLGSFRRRNAALPPLDQILELLDLARCHDVSIAPPELCLGVQLVKRLLVGALRLLNLAIRCRNVGLRHDHRRIDFYDTPLGYLEIGFLLGAVEPEDGRALLDLVTHA